MKDLALAIERIAIGVVLIVTFPWFIRDCLRELVWPRWNRKRAAAKWLDEHTTVGM